MRPSLDFDVLLMIFSQVPLKDSHTTDYKSLYKCSLVNKKWCEAAIPILWEDPFLLPSRSPKNDHEQNHEEEIASWIKSGKVIETLLQCLSKIEFEQFQKDIQNKFHHIIPRTSPKFPAMYNCSMFAYPKFMRSLSIHGLYQSSLSWFNSSIDSLQNAQDFTFSDKQNLIDLLIRRLLKLFLDHGVRFRRVTIGQLNDLSAMLKFWSNSLFRKEYKALFENLRSLDIGYMKEGKVMEMVESWNDFSTLTSLTIKMSTHLSKILSSSKRLKKIKILDGRTQNILPILSLPTPSTALQSITFKFVEFDENDPWELLSSFTNLEKLKLINCWVHPDVGYEAKKIMGFKVTKVRFEKLKLFVCSNPRSSGMSIENEGKTLLVQWGVLQHAVVVSENLESHKTRIYYEKLDKGIEVDRIEHNLYTNYMKQINEVLHSRVK